MKLSAVNSLPLSASYRISPLQSYCPLFNIFNTEGSTLPTRSKFRFNDKQKTILWQYFTDGEKNGFDFVYQFDLKPNL